VVSALIVLPVGIGALSKRLAPKNSRSTDPSPLLTRWGKHIVRRPVLTIVSGVAIMLVFAVPVSSMYLGQPDDGNQPKSETQRVAYDWTTEAFGAGFNGPFLIAIQVPENPTVKTKTDVLKLIKDLKATPDVASVAPPIVSKDKKLVTLTLIPKTSPQSQKTSDLLEQIRNQTIPDSVGNDLNVYVGGQTATLEDFSDKVTDRLPLFIAVVIGFSVLLLMAAFRSVWIPLASAAFNLLSVAAAFGIISAVFQDGIGASLIGAESGVPIISFIPVMIFAILFGLSMDYNVFLLSRIHESYNNSGDVDQSVVDGVGRIGKVIMFAGLIMASVFLAFVTQSNIAAKMMGLGLGAAILVDVFFVRLMIAPALVKLLGDRAWWFPGWLDRILPSISLEGEANQRDWINHKK
jgi:RND superfamily putative drug exporter